MSSSVSVVIPCYNAEKWIARAIQSVADQKLPRCEIIVVDDGSSDRSPDIVRSHFPQVRLFRIKNSKPAGARNFGTREASGEFIQYLDADDWLEKGKIERQVRLLESGKADMVRGDWQEWRELPDGTLQPALVHKMNGTDDAVLDLLSDIWAPQAAYLYRRALIERIGGFNEEFKVIEDVRFVLDCLQGGASMIYSQEIACHYLVHHTSHGLSFDRKEYNRECLESTAITESWWRSHGGIRPERKSVLIKSYFQIARNSYKKDAATFEKAFAAIKRLEPHFRPDTPRALAVLARIFGYRNSEEIAYRYRQIKGVLSRKAGCHR